MLDRRAATPADAKAVWESFEKVDARPTARAVALAMNQTGQFLPVGKSSVDRWHRKGWKANPAPKSHPTIEAKDKVEAAVSVLTGDATTRVDDVKEAEPAQDLVITLRELPDGKLMSLAQRESYITAIVLMREVQARANMVSSMPREIGTLQQALAGSLAASNDGMATLIGLQERMMTVIPNGDQPQAIEQDPLNRALEAFGKAASDHG